MKDSEIIKSLLSEVVIVDHISALKNDIIELRKSYLLRLADAIIASTAIYLGYEFLTADKSFQKIEELDLVIFQP